MTDLPDLPGGVEIPDDLSALLGPSGSEAEPATGSEPAAGSEAEIVRTTAVVLTQVRQAKVLAGLMALQGIEAAVVPSARGAIAVRYVEQEAAEVDPAQDLSGIPREAEALGAALSLAARSETVLLAARVSEVDGEITGQVKARRYRGGQLVEEPPPGLVLAQADSVAERLLIGLVQAPQISGYISSTTARGGESPRGGLRWRRRERDS